jgi:predicted amidohydrolase YtcJ
VAARSDGRFGSPGMTGGNRGFIQSGFGERANVSKTGFSKYLSAGKTSSVNAVPPFARRTAFVFVVWTWMAVFARCAEPRPVAGGGKADVILVNGKVVTVDAAFSIHEAVAIRGGRILAVGSNVQMEGHRGEGTRMVDLGGRMVLPGLMDSHTHPQGASLTEFDHVIPEMDSIGDVLEYVRGRAAVSKAGEWIVVRQVFITRLRERRYPTRKELDEAAPNHPVVFSTGPDSALNSRAMQLSGIDRNFRAPNGGPGFAEMDPKTGEPTGILRNCPGVVKSSQKLRSATPEEARARLKELFADYNAVGITAVCDRNADLEGINRYEALREKGELTVRVSVSHGVSPQGELPKVLERIQSVGRHVLHTHPDEFLRIIGIKCFLDGGMLTGSAYMRDPWGISATYGISDPGYRGVRFIEPERLEAVVREALGNGLQFTAHVQGDGAVEALLGTYEQLAKSGVGVRENRCNLTHSSFMSEWAVRKAAELGVTVDLQPAWLYLDGATLLAHFGNARLRWFIPLRSLFEAGATVGGGSDHMQKIGSKRSINPYNPFLGMAVAVSRRGVGMDHPLHPQEALTREQAIRFYTINNARLLFREADCGSIEPGKLADLAVLDTDLLTCPEAQISDAKVWKTFLGGKVVFARD